MVPLEILMKLKAAWLKDQHQPYGFASAMAKQYCADMAMEVTTEAVQIHGGYGYMDEYAVQKWYRDAKILELYEGTKEAEIMTLGRVLQM